MEAAYPFAAHGYLRLLNPWVWRRYGAGQIEDEGKGKFLGAFLFFNSRFATFLCENTCAWIPLAPGQAWIRELLRSEARSFPSTPCLWEALGSVVFTNSTGGK